MARYPQELMVKQFVATLRGRFCDFTVFETGDPRYYLFSVTKDGVQTGLQIPVRKSDLRDDVRRALRAGLGSA